MTNIFGRQVVLPLINKSGGSVAAGDVVIYDTSNNEAFTTTTSAASALAAGIAQETIANNATGRVLAEGYAALVNVSASVTRGDFGATHTVAKQAADVGAARIAGTFCRFLKSGTTPSAFVYPVDLAGAALTDPTTMRGDLIYRGAAALARRAVGTSGQRLTSDGTDPVWAASAILLDYDLASDITNQAITAASFFDLIANQNFTKVYTNSLIVVNVRGYGFGNDATANQYLMRANIDSGGTPVLKYFSAASNNNTTTVDRANALVGGSVYVSGLSAAVHTVKVQFTATGANDHLYCRASTNGPTTGAEFLNVQVIELL